MAFGEDKGKDSNKFAAKFSGVALSRPINGFFSTPNPVFLGFLHAYCC
jgi:hypothetical protein